MAGRSRQHGVRTGTRALVVLLATAALVSCGGKTVETVAAPAAAPPVAPAGNVRVDVQGDEVDVHWVAPLAPVQGYELYLDSRPPIPLPASTTSFTWGRLPAGTEHLVQVVAVGEDGRSRPVEASFTVPWKASDAPDESTPAPAAPSGEGLPAATAPGTAPAGTAPAGPAPAGSAPTGTRPAAATPAAAAPARADSPATGSGPAPATFTVRGTLTMYNSIPNSVDPVASCSTERTGLRLEVRNGAGAIVTLATLQSTTPREVEQDDYAMQYSCDFPYSITLDGASPVYTLRAYYEGIDRIEPWTTTLGVAALRSSPPKPYLSFCLACG